MKILKLQADWCAPCKTLTKTMEEMNIKLPVEYVDITSQRDVATMFGVRSIPTMILVDSDNKEVRRVNGAISKEQINEFIGEYC
jgi:putative thioredoxin